MNISVFITDDHPLALAGLRNMLAPFNHITVISCFSNGEDLLEALAIGLPDVLLLDILLPGKKGMELATIISNDYPSVKILAISSLDAPSSIKSMMRNGCKGYLLKSTDQATLVQAIETIHAGGEFIEPLLKEQMFQNMLKYKKPEQRIATVLTRREKEVLQLIVQELSNQEIADKLFLSIRTIENHRFNLYQKLDVKNSIGLLNAAIQMGITPSI